VLTCGAAVTCGIGCLQFGGFPPMINLTCLSGCVAQACPNAQVFINGFFSCALGALFTCGSPACVLSQCSQELALCVNSEC